MRHLAASLLFVLVAGGAAAQQRPVIPADIGPFDGKWVGAWSCGTSVGLRRDGLPGAAPYTSRREITIRGGVVDLSLGTPEAPNSRAHSGQINRGGELDAKGFGISPGGRRYPVWVEGRFEGNRFNGTGGEGDRACVLELTRDAPATLQAQAPPPPRPPQGAPFQPPPPPPGGLAGLPPPPPPPPGLRPPPPRPPAQPAAAPLPDRRFDGAYRGTIDCGASPAASAAGAENAGPLRRDYELFVRDGEVRSRVGAEGSPGFRYADGQVRSDGTLILEGRGIDQQRRSYTIRFDLRVDGPAISGNGLAGDRPCRLDLARAGGEAPLTQSAAAAPPPAPAPAPASPDGTQALLELALWDAVKGSSDPALYQDYLAKFPKGHFAAVAKSRINELKQPRPAPAAATASAEPAVDIAPELLKEKRLALVIGNGKYRNLGPLRNPANDAKAMATSLKRLDFEVIERVDATRDQMTDAIDEFGSRLQRGGVGVFFFAGHGMQVRGQNYLLPVEANPRSEVEVQGKSINAAYVMEHFAEAKNRVNIMILDACRNNPMQTQFRSAARGLAVVGRAPGGTIIAYATAPDQIAEDGDGSNGLYTSELLRHLETPNLKIEDVFKRVTTGVRQRSDGKQVPWTTGSLEGDFYFKLPGRR